MTRARYSPVHAAVVVAILAALAFWQGFAVFWRQFVYGVNLKMTPEMAVVNMAASVALFGTLYAAMWCSTAFGRARRRAAADDGAEAAPPMPRGRAVLYALKRMPWVTAVAFALNLAAAFAVKAVTGVEPAEQDLVKCLAGGGSTAALATVGAAVVFLAPVVEEAVFRGVVFGGLSARFSPVAAALASGFVFAFAHQNAATLIPLWWLGWEFAQIYRKTGRLLASMTAHAFFNAVNFALVLVVPA